MARLMLVVVFVMLLLWPGTAASQSADAIGRPRSRF